MPKEMYVSQDFRLLSMTVIVLFCGLPKGLGIVIRSIGRARRFMISRAKSAPFSSNPSRSLAAAVKTPNRAPYSALPRIVTGLVV